MARPSGRDAQGDCNPFSSLFYVACKPVDQITTMLKDIAAAPGAVKRRMRVT
jgi:hypothetical protein